MHNCIKPYIPYQLAIKKIFDIDIIEQNIEKLAIQFKNLYFKADYMNLSTKFSNYNDFSDDCKDFNFNLKWAFFPDVAIRNPLKSFGQIITVRNPDKILDRCFFVNLPQSNNMCRLYNTAPKIINIQYPTKYDCFNINDFEITKNYLCRFCSFYDSFNIRKKGWIQSFDEDNIYIVEYKITDDNSVIFLETEYIIKRIDRKMKIFDLEDEVINVAFSMTVKN